MLEMLSSENKPEVSTVKDSKKKNPILIKQTCLKGRASQLIVPFPLFSHFKVYVHKGLTFSKSFIKFSLQFFSVYN